MLEPTWSFGRDMVSKSNNLISAIPYIISDTGVFILYVCRPTSQFPSQLILQLQC